MKVFTNDLKNKVKVAIKNKQDISDLIEGVDISHSDLSYAIIKRFNRSGQNISGVDLSYAVIGEEGKDIQLSGCKALNCNFRGARFLGKLLLTRSDFRFSNFSESYMPFLDYRYGDFRGGKFCGVMMVIGSKEGYKAKFSKETLNLLKKGWIIE